MALINITDDEELKVSGDDGHGYGGVTPGKRTPTLPEGMKSETGNVMYENEFNRAVEKYYGIAMKRCGFQYLSCAAGDSDVPLYERAEAANRWGSKLHVSIHANAFTGEWQSKAKGIEVFAYNDPKSMEIGKVFLKHLLEGTPMNSRGVKDGSHLYMVRKPKMPAVLPELGFMDNIEDARHLLSDAYRHECAEELAKATCEVFGRPYVPPAKPKPAVVPSKYIGVVEVLVDDLPFREDKSGHAELIRKLGKGEMYKYYDKQDGWYNLGRGWVYGKAGAYLRDIPKK